ncbi:MAG: energy transducer TonB, partial [Candidatus Binatia bacterium]
VGDRVEALVECCVQQRDAVGACGTPLRGERDAAAPAVAQPPPPPPPPPMEKQPLPPEPVVKAAPPPKPPPPKVAAKIKPAPPKPVPVAKTAPAPAPSLAQPTAKALPAPVAAVKTTPAARARYEDVLYSWLVKHKEYPLVASRRGLQGRPVLTVRIDRRGHVIWSKVSSSSRYEMLDEAAVAMVRRADPFPPVPDEVGGDSYEFVAPVEYRLR